MNNIGPEAPNDLDLFLTPTIVGVDDVAVIVIVGVVVDAVAVVVAVVGVVVCPVLLRHDSQTCLGTKKD
eukprot:2504956-Amphidinium_carterae.1